MTYPPYRLPSGRLTARSPWLAIVGFAIFAGLSLLLGYRALGGVALMASAYLYLSAFMQRPSRRAHPSTPRALVGVLFCIAAAYMVSEGYDAAARGGLLGDSAQGKYFLQSGSLGVLVGGRPEFLVATQAIIDSPILGRGSYAKDFRYVDLLAERLSSLRYEIGARPQEAGLIPAHLYLLGSWVWAGLFGGLFWAAVLALASRLLLRLSGGR
jgi:hypothetical protein